MLDPYWNNVDVKYNRKAEVNSPEPEAVVKVFLVNFFRHSHFQ